MLIFFKIFRIPLRSGVEVEQFIVSILLTPSNTYVAPALSKETNTNKVNAVVIEAAKSTCRHQRPLSLLQPLPKYKPP